MKEKRVWVSVDSTDEAEVWVWDHKPKKSDRNDDVFVSARASTAYSMGGSPVPGTLKRAFMVSAGECREFILKPVTGKKGRKK